jgi:hypothetical protein
MSLIEGFILIKTLTTLYNEFFLFRWFCHCYMIYSVYIYFKRSYFTCAICLEKTYVDPVKKNNIILKCGHKYHMNCLALWMASNNENSLKCPMCRAPILTGIDKRF